MGIVKKQDAQLTRGSKLEELKESQVTLESIKKSVEEPTGELVFSDENNYQYNEVKRSLNEFIKAYQEYLICKDKLDEKKASLQTQTDWNVIFEGRKPTVADKEAHITQVTNEQTRKVHELYINKLYKEELYKLEVMRYTKEEE